METIYIEKFNTGEKKQYIYDGITGTVIPDNGILNSLLEGLNKGIEIEDIKKSLLDKYPINEVISSIKFVVRWKNKYEGFFLNNKNHAVKQDQAEKELIQDAIRQGATYNMVLNLTEDCNFRCKYCYLTEVYDFTRNRTNDKMSYEIGKASIDYYYTYLKELKKSIPNKKAGITFYGGEALLEYELLKKLVQYARENAPVEIILNMTTNGYLLDEEKMDFVVENDIHLAISLDGDRDNTNRNRVLTNDIGTFDRIFSNIKRFVEKYPDYINVGLVAVYDVKTDLIQNVDFFQNNNMPRIFFINEVSSVNTKYYDKFTPEDYACHQETMKELLNKYIEEKQQGKEMSNYLVMLFELRMLVSILRSRHYDFKSSLVPFTSACVPGMKISVRTDGTFDMCERINKQFPIGNIHEGINYDNVQKIINMYNEAITGGCEICIVNKCCPLCFAYSNGENNFQKKEGFCQQWRTEIKNQLVIIYTILEKNKAAFDELSFNLSDSLLLQA